MARGGISQGFEMFRYVVAKRSGSRISATDQAILHKKPRLGWKLPRWIQR
jgi:hypothetical protein